MTTPPLLVPDAGDQRDRWPKGLVRHLRIDPNVEGIWVIRVQHDGGISAGGGCEVYYTLVISSEETYDPEVLRASAEANPEIGGFFSPERDL